MWDCGVWFVCWGEVEFGIVVVCWLGFVIVEYCMGMVVLIEFDFLSVELVVL